MSIFYLIQIYESNTISFPLPTYTHAHAHTNHTEIFPVYSMPVVLVYDIKPRSHYSDCT